MSPEEGNEGPRQFKSFAWQGIGLTVPEQWELVATRGDYDSGYFGLGDSSRLRLQVKWDRAKGKRKIHPADSVAKYLRELRKKAKKDKREVEINRRLNLASLRDRELECYDWLGEERGTGMVAVCQKCERIVHVVLLGQKDESLRSLSRTVFASLQDHPEDGWMQWRFYDVEFRSPEELLLRRKELKTGCIRMILGRRREEMELVRVSLARVLLNEQSLREWFEDFYSRELKRTSWERTHSESEGHEELRLEGSPWLVLNPGRLIGRRRTTRILCRHCKPTNRIFVVSHSAVKADPERFEKIVRSVRCCEEH